jgi:hypothetical protein
VRRTTTGHIVVAVVAEWRQRTVEQRSHKRAARLAFLGAHTQGLRRKSKRGAGCRSLHRVSVDSTVAGASGQHVRATQQPAQQLGVSQATTAPQKFASGQRSAAWSLSMR